jgi:hypothetical protein
MKHDVFWAMIEAARKAGKNDQEGMCEALAEALGELEAKEIAGFDRAFRELRVKAKRWDLWGAAYLMSGGCSDDGFEYFRNWLIGVGQKVYEAALADPDSLVKAPLWLAEGDVREFESLGYVASDVYEQVAEKPLKFVGDGEVDVEGEEFDLDDGEEMRKRYPKLAGKYLED